VDRIAAAIAIGSNLGDRAAHLDYAVSRLRSFLDDLKVSRYYETAPVDVPGPAALFLNAAAVGRFNGTARELLDALLDVERERGRERPFRNASRTLDLDLVLFGGEMSEDPGLAIPHPRFRERRFVLEPLAEIAPDMRDPLTGATTAELLRRLHA
jgi:2-amino-4-hydroxy-6-hydroxymethyldihydropteridine diphosphokinase